MMLETDEIELEDIEVLEMLKESEYSVVFKVLVHETTCVMKVYHNHHPYKASSPECRVSINVRESTAYHRLKAKGLCKRRVIPDFYGTITNIQPGQWPYLCDFVDDELPPTAVLIEYVPNIHRIDLSNFSPQNVQTLRETLAEMHLAGVLHDDLYPRNMMVSRDPMTNQDRALWLDFDRAQTFSGCLSERQKTWIKEEMDRMDLFIQDLTQDNEQGELYHAYPWYYDWFGPLGWAEDYEWVKEEEKAYRRNPWRLEGEEYQKYEDRQKADGLEWNGEDWVPSPNMCWNGKAYVEIKDEASCSPSRDVSDNETEIAQPCGGYEVEAS